MSANRIYRSLLAVRPLVRAGQFAVTGERTPRRIPLLAEELLDDADGLVVDLGCGSAPLLEFVAPRRYVGIDAHGPSLADARRRRSGPGREFLAGSVLATDLSPWAGAACVVLSSVCHHLDDDEVVGLLRRIRAQAAPGRILVQDAQPTGRLGGLVTRLDDGDHLRSQAQLQRLLEQVATPRLLWTYTNPLRSFRQFLYELAP
jgi:SAM-dependent methyltransferase